MESKSKNQSYVSRSVYQKLAEENKRLMKDLKIICTGDPVDAIMLRIHWRNRFRKEEKFKAELKRILRKVLDENPDLKLHKN